MYLSEGGAFGSVPDDYLVYRAASLCHCPPWEIAERDDFWLEKALLYSGAEAKAQTIVQKRAAQQQRQTRKR